MRLQGHSGHCPTPTMAEHPTVTWEAMQDGNTFYRRQQLYMVTGKLPDLGNYIVAGCKQGGPIGLSHYVLVFQDGFLILVLLAVMRDNSKLVAVGPGHAATSLTKSQIQLYSPAGEGLLLLSVDIVISWV